MTPGKEETEFLRGTYGIKEIGIRPDCLQDSNNCRYGYDSGLFFIGKTDEEISLVCKTEDVPENATERDDGWKGFRIQGVLDFSLVGILSKISGILAEHKIGIFAVSTFNTDYILVKAETFERALGVLAAEGYAIV